MATPINIPGAKAGGASYTGNISSSYAFHTSGSSAASGNTSSTAQMSSSAPQFHRFEEDVCSSPAYMRTIRFSSGFLWDEHVLSPRRSYMRSGAAAAAETREEVQVAEIKLDDADKLLPS